MLSRTQAVLTSILCTAKQQDKDLFALIVDLLRSAEPKLLDLIPELAAESAWGSTVEEPAAPTPPPNRESEAQRREFNLTLLPVLLPGG